MNNELKVLDKKIIVKYNENKVKKLQEFLNEIICLAELLDYKIEAEFFLHGENSLSINFINNQKNLSIVIITTDNKTSCYSIDDNGVYSLFKIKELL